MFALTQQDSRASKVVVKGMISLAGYTAQALFDLGITHSFVSELNEPPELLNFQLVKSTRIGFLAGCSFTTTPFPCQPILFLHILMVSSMNCDST